MLRVVVKLHPGRVIGELLESLHTAEGKRHVVRSLDGKELSMPVPLYRVEILSIRRTQKEHTR